MASAPPSTFATANIGAAAPSTPPTSGPSNAKAEKARLAAQFGTPDITVASAPSLSAKEEKRLLEQKYQPKIELQVTEVCWVSCLLCLRLSGGVFRVGRRFPWWPLRHCFSLLARFRSIPANANQRDHKAVRSFLHSCK